MKKGEGVNNNNNRSKYRDGEPGAETIQRGRVISSYAAAAASPPLSPLERERILSLVESRPPLPHTLRVAFILPSQTIDHSVNALFWRVRSDEAVVGESSRRRRKGGEDGGRRTDHRGAIELSDAGGGLLLLSADIALT